jgi:hypothetical protein
VAFFVLVKWLFWWLLAFGPQEIFTDGHFLVMSERLIHVRKPKVGHTQKR